MIKFQTQIFNSGMLIGNIWNGLKAFVSIKKCWPFYLYWPLLIYDGFFGGTFLTLVIVPIDSQDNFEDGFHVVELFYQLCLAAGFYLLFKSGFRKDYIVASAYLAHFLLVATLSSTVYICALGFSLFYLYGKSP